MTCDACGWARWTTRSIRVRIRNTVRDMNLCEQCEHML